MLETYFRPSLQKFFVDPVAALVCRRVTSTQITLLAAAIGLLIPLFVYLHWPILAVLVMWLSGYLDVLDGTVARLGNLQSAKGAVLDIVADRWVESCCIIGIFLVAPEQRALLSLLMLASILLCISSFLVVGIFVENQAQKGFHYSPGLMERAEAFIFFTLILLLPGWFVWLASLFVILVLWTMGLRLWQFLKN